MSAELSFGAWLKRRRRGLGLTQAELGRRTGYSGETLRKVEADEERASHQMAERLAAALDIPAADRAAFVQFARGEHDGAPLTLPAQTAALPYVLPPRLHDNLPVPPTPLIGREPEVAALRALLTGDRARLVTLTGVGGTGKTRLALAVAAALRDHFEAGVYLVDLAPIRDAGLVTATIAHSLEVRETPGRPYLQALKDYLRPKALLLVLDNFEQVLDAAPLVADLLSAAPDLRILATSRETLRLRAEYVFPVEPLAVPPRTEDGGRTRGEIRNTNYALRSMDDASRIMSYPAVQLFVERAIAASHVFRLTEDNAAAVAELCRRLDGLPLAIELAAARVRVLPPQAMLQHLMSRPPSHPPTLDMLTVGARDLPPRQQTLRAEIAWSYALLSEDEQALFRRLGVFVGGATLAAVDAVCIDDKGPRTKDQEEERDDSLRPWSFVLGPEDVLDGVQSLVDKSLLRPSDNEGEPRFTMLETIREYALECLAATGEAQALQAAHAHYFLTLAETAAPHWRGSRQVEWLRKLEEEQGNLRAALDWTVTTAQAELALRLVSALGYYWTTRGYNAEGRHWIERALALQGDPSTLRLRLQIHDEIGFLLFRQGDYAGAHGHFEACLRLAREMENRVFEARALNSLGHLAGAQGDTQSATALLQQGLTLARELGREIGVGVILNNLGIVHYQAGEFDAARACLAESLGIARRLGDIDAQARTLIHLGNLARNLGAYDTARVHYRESLTLAAQAGDRHFVAVSLSGLGEVYSFQGDSRRGARLLGASAGLLETLGDPLEPTDRAEHQRASASASETLGEKAFAALTTEGRAMTLEEAVAYALEAQDAKGFGNL
ncbi:MAG: tetratricopeptide repeat protein [Anaerolineae bacterium]|nr:tetratricopeptide repeat protein [Anaerolineae bacterium]